MFIGKHNQDPVSTPVVCLNNVPVEIVTKFEYFSRILTNTGDDTPAVKACIGCGWDAFNKIKGIICSRHISMATKWKTFETNISPLNLRRHSAFAVVTAVEVGFYDGKILPSWVFE